MLTSGKANQNALATPFQAERFKRQAEDPYMANCEICGRPTVNWFKRISHVECETVPGPWHVERGEFKSFNSQAMILLERDENCLALVKGCEIADAGRGQGGVAVAIAEASDTDDNYGGEDATDTDEEYIDEAEMEEALARVPVRETGCLHVTTRRICFVGKFDSKTIPLSEVVEVHYANDTLKIIAGDSRSATYSNLGSPRGLEIAAAVIRKLTQLALSKRRPKVRKEQIKRPEWN
jgi:hypothetical protein